MCTDITISSVYVYEYHDKQCLCVYHDEQCLCV